jgi:hypothetical protein
MDPRSAEPARLDNDVERITRTIWGGLAIVGAAVPHDPMDLDLCDVMRASRAGVDIGAILRAATPRSAAEAQAV